MHPVVPSPETLAAQTCWSCVREIEKAAHFCPHCSKLQPPADSDYFSFFALERRLNIDLGALEKEFYKLSRRLHPDVYARASAAEQQWSTQKSSLLNDAYRTLRDPIARTEYLLELEGVQLEEQSKAATDRARQTGEEKKQVVPPELLEEVFDLNMQLQELKMSKQVGERDEDAVRSLEQARAHFEQRLNGLTDELKQHWNAWDMAYDRAGNLPDEAVRVPIRQKMIDVLNRRSYMSNLVREVNAALEE